MHLKGNDDNPWISPTTCQHWQDLNELVGR